MPEKFNIVFPAFPLNFKACKFMEHPQTNTGSEKHPCVIHPVFAHQPRSNNS